MKKLNLILIVVLSLSAGFAQAGSAGGAPYVPSNVAITGGTISASTISGTSSVVADTGNSTYGIISMTPGGVASSGWINVTSHTSRIRQGYFGYSYTNSSLDTGILQYVSGGHDFNGYINAKSGIQNNDKLLISPTAPTIASGFGTSPSISASNGPSSFRITIGTGGTSGQGVINLPTAIGGWNCFVGDYASGTILADKMTVVSLTTTTQVRLDHITVSTGVGAAWPAGRVLSVGCFAY